MVVEVAEALAATLPILVADEAPAADGVRGCPQAADPSRLKSNAAVVIGRPPIVMFSDRYGINTAHRRWLR